MAEYSEESDDLLETIKGWYKEDMPTVNAWRKEAKEDFRFRDGEQWNEQEKRELEDQQRPVLVFNRTGVLVDAVVGSEIGNRREVQFFPRENGDARSNEILTSAAEWFRDQCDAEDEESEAFKDTVTAGMGWTETRLDYTDNPQGEPKITQLDPFEMGWSCDSNKANLVDSTRRWRVRKMALAEAKKLFPDVDEDNLNAAWASEDDEDTQPTHIEPGNRYSGINGEDEDRGPSKKVTIVGCQYYRTETYYKTLLLGPDGMPQTVELDKAKYDIAQDSGAILQAVPLKRRTVVVCYVGRVVIKQPKPTQTGDWSWNCITGLRDKDKGTFYGIVRRAKDPQRWANKWLSQMMHILNSQAKGGIMAEAGAFKDQRQAEESWAMTDRITWLNQGALSGQSGPKVQSKPVAQFPAGFDRLLQYADEAIIKATGINMELLGMRDATQPGVLEYQRKQSGIAILATFFNSLRRYRKIQGRGMLFLIQNYLSDGRMVRIVGDEQAQYVPLTKENVTSAEYDVIVDDSPTSTNEKEKTWQILQGILPMFKGMITPEVMLTLADYSPLPASLVGKLKDMAKQQQAQPQQNPAAMLEAEKIALEREKIANERMKLQNERAKIEADAQSSQIDAVGDAADRQIQAAQTENDRIRAMAELVAAQNPPPVRVN